MAEKSFDPNAAAVAAVASSVRVTAPTKLRKTKLNLVPVPVSAAEDTVPALTSSWLPRSPFSQTIRTHRQPKYYTPTMILHLT